jgi:hypothetical protein
MLVLCLMTPVAAIAGPIISMSVASPFECSIAANKKSLDLSAENSEAQISVVSNKSVELKAEGENPNGNT